MSGRTGAILASPRVDNPWYPLSPIACGRDIDGDGWDDWISWKGALGVARSSRTGAEIVDGIGATLIAPCDGVASAAGDCDGDGIGDFLLRSPLYDHADVDSASANIVSGRDGSLLFSVRDPDLSRGQLTDVCTIGDQDGDGRRDIVLASWSSFTRKFVAKIISSRDGSITRIHLDIPGRRDSVVVRDAGDVDGDQVNDLLVGSGLEVFHVYSGCDGRLLFGQRGQGNGAMPGEEVDPGFGWTLATFVDTRGAAFVLSTCSGWIGWSENVECWSIGKRRQVFVSLPLEFRGEWHLGAALEIAGDVDADGTPDFLCVPDGHCANGAHFSVCSGRTGQVIWSGVRTRTGVVALL